MRKRNLPIFGLLLISILLVGATFAILHDNGSTTIKGRVGDFTPTSTAEQIVDPIVIPVLETEQSLTETPAETPTVVATEIESTETTQPPEATETTFDITNTPNIETPPPPENTQEPPVQDTQIPPPEETEASVVTEEEITPSS